MSLYPAPFWGKSKNRSRVASNMFPAEMARSMEMSFKNLERCLTDLVQEGQGGGS